MANYWWVGGAGTWDGTNKTNWSNTTGGAGGFGPPTSADGVNFDSGSGTGAVTTAAGAAAASIAFNTANITLTFGANITLSGNFILTSGAIDLSSYTLTMNAMSSNNSNTRSIAFGTGKIVCTSSNTDVWYCGTLTNLTITGTPNVECNYSGATGTRRVNHGNIGGGTEARAINVKITAGTDIVSVVGRGYVKNLDFTGFSGSWSNNLLNLYGSLTVSTGMTVTAGTNTVSLVGTGVQQNITSNGKTLDFPITLNGTGTTFAFQDALTQGSTRAFTITNGTIQLKDGVTSTVGALATSGTTQKVLQSASAGSQATLSQASGNFNAQYLTVKDIAATGGAKFNALNNCITQGNNSGWYFAPQLGRPLPSFAF